MNTTLWSESANIHELVDEAEGMNGLDQAEGTTFTQNMSNSFGFVEPIETVFDK
jgi:hypothetical protein